MSVSSVVILLASLLLLLLYAVVKAYRKRQQLRKIAAHFGGAKPHWLLGNLLDYPKNDVPGIFDAMVQRHTDHGKDLFSWAMLNDHMVIVSSAENVAKVVMAKQTQKSTFYQFLEVWLGQGLLLSWGDKWFQRRRIITPTFHFNILAAFAEVFNREATVLVEKLAPLANSGREFDIYEPVSLYALNSICLTSMGVDVNAQRDPTNQYVRDVKRMSELVLLRIFHVLSSFPQVYWYTMPHAWEQRKLIGRLHAFTDSVIHQRRQRLLNEDQVGRFDANQENRYAKRKETFLDLLLNVSIDGRPLSDLDIREEVDTFMFEGHDTTASAIAFTFLQLAAHREIQDRLHREIVDTLGPDHRTVPLTYGTLQNFRYLDMVVKESLRLLPPVSFIGRRLVEDLQLNGVTVPAETDCLIPIYVIHRNPDVYPDPERFDPERFADGSEQRRGPYDYMPFSVGARNCIGQRFAVLEIKISIIRMVSHYHIHPGDTIRGVRLKTDLVLRPDKGIPIKLSARPDRTE